MAHSRSVRAAFACLLWLCAVAPVRVDLTASPSTQTNAVTVRVSGFEDAQAWFRRVREHRLWDWDDSAKAVSVLSPEVLARILRDLRGLRHLLDTAATKGSTWVQLGNNQLSTTRLAPLMGLSFEEDVPLDLSELSKADNPTRRAIGRIMMRAAILHTVIAVSPSDQPSASARRSAPPIARRLASAPVRISDGRQVSEANLSAHWAIARAALDLVGPPPASSPAVRLWYQFTSAHLQGQRDYAELLPHLERARVILSVDATILLLSGAASENLAAPPVQSAVAEADTGEFAIGVPADLYKTAEDYLRRALELDPGSALARLRLGRVLQMKGEHDAAADQLQQAEAGLSDLGPKYLATLYLGRTEQVRGRFAPARAAFERAIALFPRAQSARLAIAEVAWQGSDQPGAVAGLRALFDLPSGGALGTDPWWTYDVSHVTGFLAHWNDMRLATAGAAR